MTEFIHLVDDEHWSGWCDAWNGVGTINEGDVTCGACLAAAGLPQSLNTPSFQRVSQLDFEDDGPVAKSISIEAHTEALKRMRTIAHNAGWDAAMAYMRVSPEGRLKDALAEAWQAGYLRGTLDNESDLEPADNPHRETSR